MKKLLVFREGLCPDSRELDDYLYDSEVIRSDYIDMTPSNEINCYSGTLAMHASTWDIVFKDDDKYDWWHFLCEGTDSYAIRENAFLAAIEFFPKSIRNPLNCGLHVVLRKNNYMVMAYRLPKSLSTLLNEHVELRLNSFKDGEYSYEIPEDILGPVLVSEEEV